MVHEGGRTPMKKKEFIDVLEYAIAKGRGVRVFINLDELHKEEIISIPAVNVPFKLKYYSSAYNENMRLVNSSKIQILKVVIN